MTTDKQLETILVDWRDNELPPDKAIEAIKRVMGREFTEDIKWLFEDESEGLGYLMVLAHKKEQLLTKYSPTHIIEDQYGDHITVKEDA